MSMFSGDWFGDYSGNWFAGAGDLPTTPPLSANGGSALGSLFAGRKRRSHDDRDLLEIFTLIARYLDP